MTSEKFYLNKNNHNLLKHIKNKGNVVLKTFLDFGGVSSYLTFKLSTRQRSCTISFELQMSHFGKLFQSSTKGSKNWNPSSACIIFIGRWIFELFFIFKVLKLLYDCNYVNMLCHTVDTNGILVHLYIFTHRHNLVLKKQHIFVKLPLFFDIKK